MLHDAAATRRAGRLLARAVTECGPTALLLHGALGSGKTATVTFDGTFTNDEETVEAVIYDGKVEVQKWWDYSEKQEQEIADTLTMKITNVQVIYAVSDTLQGDVNADGKFDIADVVLLQKWLLAVPNTKLADWKAADLCEDNRLDVFDLCLMKRKLIYG